VRQRPVRIRPPVDPDPVRDERLNFLDRFALLDHRMDSGESILNDGLNQNLNTSAHFKQKANECVGGQEKPQFFHTIMVIP
jgi:hypothetical protein